MQHFVERDILVHLTLMTLVCTVAPNNSWHKMYQILFNVLDNLGFTVQDKKSVLIPTKKSHLLALF